MTFKIAFVYYSLYGHIQKLIDTAAEGVKEKYGKDAEVTIFRVPETLPQEVLTKMHAAPVDAAIPIVKPDDLKAFDGIVFGIPTRYGRAVAQISAFFDSTGGLWGAQALKHKIVTILTSTATQGGGQETTILTTLPYLAHHGAIFVPFGYAHPGLFIHNEARGGGPWGAGTIAGSDGSRQPSALELEIAKQHGADFAGVVHQFVAGKGKQ